MFINREIAQLLIFQRNELTNPTLQKIRKIFGRRFFTKFVSKYLIQQLEKIFLQLPVMLHHNLVHLTF